MASVKNNPAARTSRSAKAKKPVAPKPPASLDEATTRIRRALGGRAEVSLDANEDRVMVRIDSEDQATVDKSLAFIGVRKSNTGIRDIYRFGQYEVTVSPWQSAFPA